MDMGDNDYINGTMFRKLPPVPVMENNRPTETGKTESCFQKNWSIALKVSLLGLIALLSVLLIIVSALLSAASVRVEEGKKSNKMTQVNDNYTELAQPSCPDGWYTIRSSCYYFSTTTGTWQDAKYNCTAQQSQLLIVTSEEEIGALMPLITGKRFWIGLKRSNSQMTWVDGSHLTFSHWAPIEPNNLGGSENCVEMKAGGWNDLDCDIKLYYICKK